MIHCRSLYFGSGITCFFQVFVQMLLNFSYIFGIGQCGNDFLNDLPLLNIKECPGKINVKYPTQLQEFHIIICFQSMGI